MGKNLREKRSAISSSSNTNENEGGGCAWGLLHIIKYHHWRHVKKRLALKSRYLVGSHVDVPRSGNMQEHDYGHMDKYTVEERSTDSSLGKNSSVKARIKAFLSDEMHRKKGRHHRSSSCPVRSHLTRMDSIHHLKLPYLDTLAEILESEDLSPRSVENKSEISSASSELDSLPMNSSEQPITSLSTMVVGDQSEHDHVADHQNKLVENRTFLQEELESTTEYLLKQKSIHERQQNVDALASHPKEYLDALDIISLNKELLVKILQDPGSPLAHHFSNQQALSAKRGLDKCETFPLPGSLRKRSSNPRSVKQMHKADCKAEGNQAKAESSRNPSPASAKPRKNQVDTQAVVKRFKDLKQKIKHVIREGRKERHIITMDAIIHKVPHGQKVEVVIDSQTKNSAISEECEDIPVTGHETDCSVPSFKQNEKRMRQMRRASSLNDSLDRYCQLYQTSFNREARQQTSEGLKMRVKDAGSPFTSVPKYLARIYSLPELKYFLDHEEPSDTFSSEVPTNSVVNRNVSTSSNEEQKSLDFPLGSEDQLPMDDHLESVSQEASLEIGAINSVTGDELALSPTSNNEDNTQLGSHMHDYVDLTAEELEIEAVVIDEQHNLVKQCEEEEELDVSACEVSETSKNKEIRDKDLIEEMPHLQVDAKDKAEFSYVRDVLELSGFSGNAFLGTWHSDDQPVNPLVYEEVEGCLVLDPDCCGNEGGQCDHLLMFDLINEVLMEIYARSYSYCPFRLSCLSHISPMPAGPHVLTEVWGLISWYLSFTTEVDQSLDYVVENDLAKSYGWMNLQFDTECVGLELEDLIFDDLLDEVIWA